MEDWTESLSGLFFFSLLCGMLIVSTIMAAEFLHCATNGRLPRLIEWHSGPALNRRDADEEEQDEEPEEEIEEIHTYPPPPRLP